MTFSKRKLRRDAEGPSRLQRFLDSLTRRFGDLHPNLVAALKREARKRRRAQPKLKVPRGRSIYLGRGGGFKLRKRVDHQGLANPFCPRLSSVHNRWNLSIFAIRERLGLPQDTPYDVVMAKAVERSKSLGETRG